MNNKIGGRRGFWLGVGLILAILCLAASFLASDVSNFYSHLNSFSYGVKNYDRYEAQRGLENIKNDYNVFLDRQLQYFADRLLFNKMYRYEAAVSILNEDYEKAETEDLKGREDDYYASYMNGIAKFKVLYAAFQKVMVTKDKKQMTAIVDLVLEKVKPDFENCVKKGPGPASNFNCSFNYDLTSDPKAALKALMAQKPRPKFVLGLPEGHKKGAGKEPGKKGSPRLDSDENKDAGKGGARKVG